jgi:hypothetical protein
MAKWSRAQAKATPTCGAVLLRAAHNETSESAGAQLNRNWESMIRGGEG